MVMLTSQQSETSTKPVLMFSSNTTHRRISANVHGPSCRKLFLFVFLPYQTSRIAAKCCQGVDLQNQPFSGIWPIPSGESWLCDIANHLKFNVDLDKSDIAVISGGVSGPQTVDGIQNFPDSVFECAAIDVVGIHGYFPKEIDATAGTPWANMFVPGNTLTARAKGKSGQGKLLLVEEWAYVDSKFGLFYKKEAIFDQGNALNMRGIPWVSLPDDIIIASCSYSSSCTPTSPH